MAILVTGGCGFVGTALTKSLLENGEKVVLLDICKPKNEEINENLVFVKADITSKSQLFEAFQGRNIKAVIHVAGFGLAGTSNLPAFDKTTKKINIDGTLNIIEACVHFNVKALVFTSTVNVVFQGKPIRNGDEESHDWIQSGHLDVYSKSKHKAEKLVIIANGRLTSNGRYQLQTCVLRLGGVYGPNEKTILQRSLDLMSSKVGYLSFCHRQDLKIDFCHIDNAVQGHVKAMNKLLELCQEASGQIFYLNDDNPSNLFFFLDPLYTLLDPTAKSCPTAITIPPKVTIFTSLFFNGMSRILGKKFRLPFWGFTYMESYKINVSHFFSIEKARRILSYEPKRITAKDWDDILATLQTKQNM